MPSALLEQLEQGEKRRGATTLPELYDMAPPVMLKGRRKRVHALNCGWEW